MEQIIIMRFPREYNLLSRNNILVDLEAGLLLCTYIFVCSDLSWWSAQSSRVSTSRHHLSALLGPTPHLYLLTQHNLLPHPTWNFSTRMR